MSTHNMYFVKKYKNNQRFFLFDQKKALSAAMVFI